MSNTYNRAQYGHYSTGYAPQQPSSMYPSIAPASSNVGPEGYYTGASSDPYARAPLPSYSHHQQYDQPQQYGGRQRGGSASSSTRAPSLKYRQASSDHIHSSSRLQSQQYVQSPVEAQAQHVPLQQHPGAAPGDDAAAYYYYSNESQQAPSYEAPPVQTQGPDAAYDPNHSYQSPPAMAPLAGPPQQSQYPPSNSSMPVQSSAPQQIHQLQRQVMAPRASVQAQQQYPSASQAAQYAHPQGLAHESQTVFPEAPTHQPQMETPVEQRRAVEESLIDL